MKTTNQLTLLVLGTLCAYEMSATIAPLGMLIPYNLAIVPEAQYKKFQVTALTQGAYTVQGFNENGDKVNALQTFEATQNALALFQGHAADSSFVQILNGFAMGPGGTLSPNAGTYSVTGDFASWGLTFEASYLLGYGITVQAYLPYWSVSLNNVNWVYQNTPETFADANIEQNLFSAFATDAQTLFNLNIGNWKQRGFGDLTVLCSWQQDFPQFRGVLKNVHPHIYFGLSLPTGVKENINNICPVSLGCDGALAVPFGAGLNLNLWQILELGANAQFWYQAGTTQLARIQTYPTQTSLLLPIATQAHKEFGFTQDFNLYGKVIFGKGVSLKVLYEYMRSSEDQIYPIDPSLDYTVANQLASLEEKTYHNILVVAAFDGAAVAACKPQVNAFIRIPVNGENSISAGVFGLQVSLEF